MISSEQKMCSISDQLIFLFKSTHKSIKTVKNHVQLTGDFDFGDSKLEEIFKIFELEYEHLKIKLSKKVVC